MHDIFDDAKEQFGYSQCTKITTRHMQMQFVMILVYSTPRKCIRMHCSCILFLKTMVIVYYVEPSIIAKKYKVVIIIIIIIINNSNKVR